jgi:hypothetical protein
MLNISDMGAEQTAITVTEDCRIIVKSKKEKQTKQNLRLKAGSERKTNDVG